MLKTLIYLTLMIISLAACAPSPVTIPDNFQPSSQTIQPESSSSEALTAFQEDFFADDEDAAGYFIGAGDELSIDVWGYPELSGKHVVGPDGVITLPLVGSFQITELTREQAARAIRQKLTDTYYADLSVTVRVDEYTSNRILILGRVRKPGAIKFGMTAPTLLEAIALAGGTTIPSKLLLPGETLPFTRCAIFRGRDRIVWLDLEPLLMGRNLDLNLKLKRNDIIYIPELREKLVYVLGAVNKPGAFPLTANTSFLEMLAKAGGTSRDAASSKINIIRPSEKINASIDLDDLLDGNNKVNLSLQENDIIYVPTNTLSKVNYAFGFLNPISQVLGIYADIESIRANRRLRSIDQENARLEQEKTNLETQQQEFEQNQILE
ncbi:polysaccharide biosynthesis/export family protein [Candidatus Albibeggiatoa sp. nov. NOAA]|uniref:polysaccharide biosynthesis/export family protein n=1 Tax=Candidatus Albibeggiatoa sp. nov. NOAA TaxID=3162724 RepID=UPI0032F799E3|nr:polysaccharide export protein [Thiotrichaceae bacterium]